MEREITIGSNVYSIDVTPETATQVLEKIIQWMEMPDHYAANCGEGIMQNDNTIIDAPVLVSDIIDDILKPKFLRELD